VSVTYGEANLLACFFFIQSFIMRMYELTSTHAHTHA
jgi:hypothetical protein